MASVIAWADDGAKKQESYDTVKSKPQMQYASVTLWTGANVNTAKQQPPMQCAMLAKPELMPQYR